MATAENQPERRGEREINTLCSMREVFEQTCHKKRKTDSAALVIRERQMKTTMRELCATNQSGYNSTGRQSKSGHGGRAIGGCTFPVGL